MPWRVIAAYGLMSCALVAIICVNLLPGAYARSVLTGERPSVESRYAAVDAPAKLATASGNAAMIPIGLWGRDSQHEIADLEMFYFRGNYVAYPNRLFLVNVPTIEGAFGSVIDPNPAWMLGHHITAILRIAPLPGGGVQTSVQFPH